jgi:hypothetical protein
MVRENFSTIRHDLIFNANDFHHIKVVIAGAGSVGSRVAEELAALGVPSFEIYDPDVVEAVNIGSQAYTPDHVGLSKVDAIKEICSTKSGCSLEAHRREFHGLNSTANVYFLCVNGLPMRRLIVENIVKHNPHAEVIIEVRMGVIHGEVFFFNPQLEWQVAEWLRRTTGDETEVGTTACGTKLSVGFVSKALAQIAIGNFVHWCAKHAPAYTGELTRDNDQVIRTLHDTPIANRVLYSAIPVYTLTDVWEAPRINPLLVDDDDLWSL